MSKNNPEQVPDNITSIGAARSQKSRAKQVPHALNDQTPINQVQAVKTASEARKTGADETGADLIESGAKQVRTRGQRGPDKQVRKSRYDGSPNTLIPPDDRGRIVQHNLQLMRLGKLKDRNDAEEVRERAETYFSLCAENQIMPTVAGFALALGIDRTTLWLWMDNRTGVIKNPEVLDALKMIYSMINTQYEELLTEGKMIPVGAFFLLQNNHGYRNQTDHVVVASAEPEPDTVDIAARAGLLEEGDK